MSARCNILPDPRFQELKGALEERLDQVASGIDAATFASLLDPLMRGVLRSGFAEAHADEGTVWLADEAGEHLVPAYNTGPHSARFVGSFRQPLREGLICMVFSTEQAFMENEVFRNELQSKRLDTLLEVQTHALLAVPFSLVNRCRGVVSCVQLRAPGHPGPPPPGFAPEDLTAIQRAATLLSRLIEHHLLGRLVGRSSE